MYVKAGLNEAVRSIVRSVLDKRSKNSFSVGAIFGFFLLKISL